MRYTNKKVATKAKINTNQFLREGESIEQKLRRVTATKEPIECDFTPEIYQERKAGVDPMCDIRTDKFEMAQAACDKMSRTYLLARMNRDDYGKDENGNPKKYTYVTDSDGNIVKAESVKK